LLPSVNTDADKAGSWLTAKGLLRVREITVVFWIIKGLSTAMGESTSDFLVHAMAPALAVVLGFAGLVVALIVQFWQRRYVAWSSLSCAENAARSRSENASGPASTRTVGSRVTRPPLAIDAA